MNCLGWRRPQATVCGPPTSTIIALYKWSLYKRFPRPCEHRSRCTDTQTSSLPTTECPCERTSTVGAKQCALAEWAIRTARCRWEGASTPSLTSGGGGIESAPHASGLPDLRIHAATPTLHASKLTLPQVAVRSGLNFYTGFYEPCIASRHPPRTFCCFVFSNGSFNWR